jgi:2-oxoglutarate dehydrogenase E1 component
VVMSPKSLLRHPRCISTLEDLTNGHFQKVIAEEVKDPSVVKNIVFCSGKIYYELLEHREMITLYQSSEEEADRTKVRNFCKRYGSTNLFARLEAGEKVDSSRTIVIRVEQLYPFPEEEIRKIISQFNAPKVAWCQEEPRNMGAWPMVDEWLCEMLDGGYPDYIGRSRSASPATGSSKIHKAEQSAIIDAVFRL